MFYGWRAARLKRAPLLAMRDLPPAPVTGRRQNKAHAAMDFARDWYMERCVEDVTRRRAASPDQRLRPGCSCEPSPAVDAVVIQAPPAQLRGCGDGLASEFEVITMGERNELCEIEVRHHPRSLTPFFGDTAGGHHGGQGSGISRAPSTSRVDARPAPKKPAARPCTEIVALRQILKTANHGWIRRSDMSAPYKTSGKLEHRAWFARGIQDAYEATRERAKNPPKRAGASAEFHDYVLFMGSTGCGLTTARMGWRRQDREGRSDGRARILETRWRQRGVGLHPCPARLRPSSPDRKRRAEADRPGVGKSPRELMNTVLDELNLKFDRDGHIRTYLQSAAYLLRLLEGADIYQVARTAAQGRDDREILRRHLAATSTHPPSMFAGAARNGFGRKKVAKSTK